MYLLRSIQNVNKTAAIFLQLQSGIQLTEQQLPSYKLHQRQLKMGKKKTKGKKTKNKKRKKERREKESSVCLSSLGSTGLECSSAV